jgi:hypothetical protein
MKFISEKNNKVLKKILMYDNVSIDLWDFIKGDYSKF